MKLTKTFYTCDLCGWTVENETELVSHTIPRGRGVSAI